MVSVMTQLCSHMCAPPASYCSYICLQLVTTGVMWGNVERLLCRNSLMCILKFGCGQVCKYHESRGCHYAPCWFLHSCMVYWYVICPAVLARTLCSRPLAGPSNQPQHADCSLKRGFSQPPTAFTSTLKVEGDSSRSEDGVNFLDLEGCSGRQHCSNACIFTSLSFSFCSGPHFG